MSSLTYLNLARGFLRSRLKRDLQGRVACEVSAGNELVTTEIIFAGVLSDLTPEEAVAVLSALVFQVLHTSSHLKLIRIRLLTL